jgi:fibronectin-binding autotransporter adhesin
VSAGAYTLTGAGTVTVGAGGMTVSGTGAVTLASAVVGIGTGGLTQSGGSITATTASITTSGSVALTVGAFTEGNSLVTMTATGTTVRVVGPNKLSSLTIGSGGTGTVSISTNDLTMADTLTVTTNWTFNTSTRNLNVTGNVLVNSGGILNGSIDPASIVVTGDTTASGAINLSGGNYTTNNLTVSGTVLALGTEILTVNGSTTLNGAGVLTLNGATSAVTGNTTVNATGTINLGPAGGTYTNGGAVNLTAAGASINLQGGSFTSTGDTTVTAGTINLQLGSYVTNSLTVSGAAGHLIASSAVYPNAETITVNDSLSFSAGNVNFTPAFSTVIMGGPTTPVSFDAPSPNHIFYELQINKGGAVGNRVNLSTDITILHSVTITSGTLSAGTHAITMEGTIWDNAGSKTGIGAFNPGTGEVFFTTTSILTIKGNNSWFDFTCTTDNKIIQFEPLWTQTVLASGNFHVEASDTSNRIVLTTNSPDFTPNGFPPPNLQGQWVITILSVLPQTIDNVDVSWSWATISITPGPGAKDSGNNHNWLFVIPIVASWTIDTNRNGRIDGIRVQVVPGTQLSDNFPVTLTANVNGYSVTGFTTGGALSGGDDVFDITIAEGLREDTDAHPTWQLLTNPLSGGLYGVVGGALVEFGSKVYTAQDGSRPVITYTTAAVGSNKAYVHFSELVYGNAPASAPIVLGSLSYSGGAITALQPVQMTGSGAHGAIVTLSAPLTATDIFPGPTQTISAVPGSIWGAAATPDDPGGFANTNTDGNLPPNNARSSLGLPHNISDVGVNFITPVFALNQNVLRDPTLGGLGMVTNFDGSKWLLPQDALIEARIMVPALAGSALTVFWDVNPPASVAFNKLWIPSTATTFWATPGNLTGDSAHNPNTQARSAAQTNPNGPLRDFVIPGTDSEIKDGARLEFLIILDDGAGHRLPNAYLADPNDPSTVRPFEYDYHGLKEQRGQVTISNNLINPDKGEVAFLHYVMPSAGKVTITVFNLSGDIVNVLANTTQPAGEHTTAWNGKNRGGRIVARGIYFVRVVGPGFDEIRKVLVVR